MGADALLIAQVLRFGLQLESSPPDDTLLALKQLTRYRADLAHQVVRVKKQVTALLDQVFPEYTAVFRDLFGAASLAILAQAATPEELAVASGCMLSSLSTAALLAPGITRP